MALTIGNLSKAYPNGFRALKNLSLTIDRSPDYPPVGWAIRFPGGRACLRST